MEMIEEGYRNLTSLVKELMDAIRRRNTSVPLAIHALVVHLYLCDGCKEHLRECKKCRNALRHAVKLLLESLNEVEGN